MRRINFSVADLARTRVSTNVDKLVETLFALELLSRGGGGAHFAAWRSRTLGLLNRDTRSLVKLAKVVRPIPDLRSILDLSATTDDAAPRVPPTPAGVSGSAPRSATRAEPARISGENLLEVLRGFYNVAVAPYWQSISARIEADVGARGQMILAGGVERLLETLQPNAQWSGGTLSIPDQRHEDIDLAGAGLILSPSLFLFDRACTFVNQPSGPPVLAFPVPFDLTAATTMWAADTHDTRALSALVGSTRAEIIRSLLERCTTTELGRRMGISTAAVSQHTSVLREAGLIITDRWQNTAQHSLTSLGVAMLARYGRSKRQRAADVDFPRY
jgi:DNA-binding transcriptional ArsR family regulator